MRPRRRGGVTGNLFSPFNFYGANDEIPLIGPNYLHPAFTTLRASAGTAFDSGGSLVEFGNNVPRLTNAGLLIEGQRTNGNNNPRGEGGVVGTASHPSNWSVFSSGGLTTTFVARGVQNNREFVDLRIAGTSTGTFHVQAFSPSFAVTAGQPSTGSVWASVVGGSLANITGFSQQLRWSSGAVSDVSFTPTATPARFAATGTAPAGATTAAHTFGIGFANGAAIDVTLRFSLPQPEPGAAFATSPIRPPVGSPGVSSRLTDIINAPLSALGIPENGACTVVGRFTLPQAVPAGVIGAVLYCIDATGSGSSRRFLSQEAGTSQLFANTIGGPVTSIGTFTPGTPVGIATHFRADGGIRASVAGGSVVSVIGTPLTGQNTFRLGNTGSGNPALNGTINSLRFRLAEPSDAELQALSLNA